MSKSSTNHKTQKQEDSRVFCIDMFKGKQSRNFNKSWTEFHNSISNAQECVHLFVEGFADEDGCWGDGVTVAYGDDRRSSGITT